MRLLLAFISTQLAAQVAAVVSLSNGVQLRIGLASPTSLKTELAPASGNSFYRIFRDQNGLAVYAYELSVERTPDGTQFRVRAMPVGDEFANRFPKADAGKPVPTLSAPRESPLLPSGGRFSIEIPTDPGLRENLEDVAQVRVNARGGAPAEGSQTSGAMRLSALQVRINGSLVSPPDSGSVVSGRYVMFYLPGRGGYFFASEPADQRTFAQAAVVDRTHLHFTVDNDVYDCDSATPILGASERGQIWVYHDANYRPVGNWTKSNPADSRDEFFTAASDSLKWWLP